MQSLYENALALKKSGRLKEAIREFHLLAENTPDINWKATFLLDAARCYADLGRFDDAERELQEIRVFDPSDAIKMNASLVAAWLSAQKGEHEKAALQYENILHDYAHLWESEYRDVYEDAFFRRAIELAGFGEYAEAVPLFKEAVSFSSLTAEDQQEVHMWLGICHDGLSEYNEAMQEFLNVIAFNLDNDVEADGRYRLARLYFLRGEFVQAKHQLESVLRGCKKSSRPVPLKSIYKQLSDTCYYLGEKENADRYAAMARNIDE